MIGEKYTIIISFNLLSVPGKVRGSYSAPLVRPLENT